MANYNINNYIYKFAKSRLAQIDDSFLDMIQGDNDGNILSSIYRTEYYNHQMNLSKTKLSAIDLMSIVRMLDKILAKEESEYSFNYISTKAYIVAVLEHIVTTLEKQHLVDVEALDEIFASDVVIDLDKNNIDEIDTISTNDNSTVDDLSTIENLNNGNLDNYKDSTENLDISNSDSANNNTEDDLENSK